MINEKCTLIDIDIVFAKVKQKFQRKINYDEFCAALYLCAEKREESMKALSDIIVKAGGPKYYGTTIAESVRLHDDKSQYTGVHARGGPSTVDYNRTRVDDMALLCDRSEADVRGVPKRLTLS